MARPERLPLAAIASLVATSCTAFNGKTLYADAGSDGGGVTEAGQPCGCADGLVACEDFEGEVGPPWSAFGDPLPSTDSSRAHCGKSSLRLHVPALAAGQSYVTALTESATFSDGRLAAGLFARAWVFASGAAITEGNHMALLEMRQKSDPFLGVAAQLGASRAAITDWTTTPAGFAESTDPFPSDAWVCVEWQVVFGASNGASRLWIGGESSPSAALDATNTTPSPPYEAMFAGVYFTGPAAAQPAFDLWIDELAIDTKRIGCGK
jgi:hypothetical protein